MSLRQVGRQWIAIDVVVDIKLVRIGRVGTSTASALSKTRSSIVGMPGAVLVVLTRSKTTIAWPLVTGKIRAAPRHVVATAHKTARARTSRRGLRCTRSTGLMWRICSRRRTIEDRRRAGVSATTTATGIRAASRVVGFVVLLEIVLLFLA